MDFVKGEVTIPHYKRCSYKKDLGKLLSLDALSLRSASSILGKIRSLLVCFPGLRLFTDQLCEFVKQSARIGFDTVLPLLSCLKSEGTKCMSYLRSWSDRHVLGDVPNRYIVANASDRELGAIDLHSSQQVHA